MNEIQESPSDGQTQDIAVTATTGTMAAMAASKPNSQQRSNVWMVFVVSDGKTNNCLLCKENVKHCTSRCNLWQHSQHHH